MRLFKRYRVIEDPSYTGNGDMYMTYDVQKRKFFFFWSYVANFKTKEQAIKFCEALENRRVVL